MFIMFLRCNYYNKIEIIYNSYETYKNDPTATTANPSS